MFDLTRREWAALLLMTFCALVLRLYRLESIPPGLHHDEALNGLEARELWRSGERPIYLGSGFNGEPLLEYSIMLSQTLFGFTPFAVRLPSALYGALTIPIVFLLARELFRANDFGAASLRSGSAGLHPPAPASRFPPPGSQLHPPIAAFVLATLYWHLNTSREGYKPVFMGLFGALVFWWLLKALQLNATHATHTRRSTRYAILAGLALGLSAYTYPSIRFLYPVVVCYVLFRMICERAFWRAYLERALIAAAFALLVFAPLGVYYIQHPDAFFRRSEQVAVRNSAEAWANLPKVTGMFFVQGDENPRHNIPGRPALDAILSVGFVVGLARALWQWRQPTHFLLLGWLLAMLIPSVVTEAAPNFLRVLGASVPTVLLIALGFNTILNLRLRHLASVFSIFNVGSSQSAIYHLQFTILWAALVTSALGSLYAYFIIMPTEPRMWTGFDVGLWRIGEFVRGAPTDAPIYLTPFTTEQATIQFAQDEPRAAFKWFDGRKCLVAPPSERAATLLIVNEDFRTLQRAQHIWPQGQITQQIPDFAGQPYLSVFRVPPQAAAPQPQVVTQRVWAEQIELIGYDIAFEGKPVERVQAGQGVPLLLYWRALRPLPTDYTVFTQLLGAPNARKNGAPLWGQRDKQPCETFYPTTRWSVGETIVEDFNLVTDPDTPTGAYRIALGWYELASGQRLKLADGADHLLIGPVVVSR